MELLNNNLIINIKPGTHQAVFECQPTDARFTHTPFAVRMRSVFFRTHVNR